MSLCMVVGDLSQYLKQGLCNTQIKACDGVTFEHTSQTSNDHYFILEGSTDMSGISCGPASGQGRRRDESKPTDKENPQRKDYALKPPPKALMGVVEGTDGGITDSTQNGGEIKDEANESSTSAKPLLRNRPKVPII